ncbi:MAG: DUF5343 domain-containing protein [Patescibacteria group bacterium]|uniref:DUF5343 domain-containing protein n=1 Tax=candidate division WWE3 bacterium TaxID=2053526 RepID=A0A955J2N6_UNCKA|nr:DUF5343 domain-containing protein [candidate division WWE3 bacterium]
MHQLYPLITNLNKFDDFLETLVVSKTPAKFTYAYLNSLGYSSSKDREFVKVLIMLGFLGSTGIPTDLYLSIKNKDKFPRVLAVRLSILYKEIFKLNAAANTLPDYELTPLFSSLTGYGQQRSLRYALTFKHLVAHADFGVEVTPVLKNETNVLRPININLTLNVTSPAELEGFINTLREHHIF